MNNELHVVAIGASAGGLEALQDFFLNMPPDSGLVFAVIQHLSPDYKSLMVELLSKCTNMNVVRVEDGMPLTPNTVFLIPPKKNMEVKGAKLRLSDQGDRHGLNLPIDIFLQSLAKDQGERAVGIILSGTGSDGTRGVRAIKETGGIVMVQAPESAKFDGMPRSALNTRLADYTLKPSEMPAALLGYIHHPYVAQKPASSGTAITTEEDALTHIFSTLQEVNGVDFTYYKPTTVVRRIERRMGIAQSATIEEYALLLRNHQSEAQALFRDLLIGVTKFFRNEDAFKALQSNFIPKIIHSILQRRESQVRVWVVGCSTGEEAYSIAMLLCEELEKVNTSIRVKIFATDIDRAAIETASNGFYPDSLAADIEYSFLEKYFDKVTGGFSVKRKVREMVVFAQQNVAKDPPFTKIDLISCRNLLIYLQPVLQKKVLSIFNYSLRPDGYLFLGSSETVGEMDQEFVADDSKSRIYRHTSQGGVPLKDIQPISPSKNDLVLKASAMTLNYNASQREAMQQRSAKEAFYQDLLNRVAASILVIDDNLQLVHTFGRSTDFLHLQPGQASLDVLSLLPRELALALSSAVHRVRKDQKKLSYSAIRLKNGEASRALDMSVEPLDGSESRRKLYCVTLTEKTHDCPSVHVDISDAGALEAQRITDLEQELQFTKENLQATIEELQTSNEELQATNEELLAANEELQSTNEELQSVNEELNTVNSEYQEKIEELTELYNDMDNFFNGTDIGTLFLDRDMRIRRFTPPIKRYLNLQEQDIGRPISDFALPGMASIDSDATALLQSGEVVEKTVQDAKGEWHILRLMPYRESMSSNIVGFVVIFIDITKICTMQANINRYDNIFGSFLKNNWAMIHFKDTDGVITSANSQLAKFLGKKEQDIVGKRVEDVFSAKIAEQKSRAFQEVLRDKQAVKTQEDTGDSSTNGALVSIQVPVFGATGEIREVVDLELDIRATE